MQKIIDISNIVNLNMCSYKCFGSSKYYEPCDLPYRIMWPKFF